MLTLAVRGASRQSFPPPLRRALKAQVGRAMRAAVVAHTEVCLSLTDDAEVLALNRQFAGEDHATDVLSFAQAEAIVPQGTPMVYAGAGLVLGDIVISLETAARQAQAAGHDLPHELLHLAVHGLCHLLGYDHATPAQEQVMFGYEALLREQARGAGPVTVVPPPVVPASDRRRSPA